MKKIIMSNKVDDKFNQMLLNMVIERIENPINIIYFEYKFIDHTIILAATEELPESDIFNRYYQIWLHTGSNAIIYFNSNCIDKDKFFTLSDTIERCKNYAKHISNTINNL